MRFKAAPFRFGCKTKLETENPGMSVKDLVRRQAILKKAAEIVPHLPAPGEALHALMTGRYDLTSLLVVILDQLDGCCTHLRVATLGFASRNVFDLKKCLQVGKVKKLTIECSKFFKTNSPSVFKEAFELCREYPGSRIAAPRNHAKVICIEMASGAKFSIEGSANLRTNSNQEQVCIINHAGLHDWHAKWIDEQVDLALAEVEVDANPTEDAGLFDDIE